MATSLPFVLHENDSPVIRGS